MRIGFLTQHGKEDLLRPILADGLDAEVFRVEGFDTDTLGTFTREITRQGTQVEAATRKAELANISRERLDLIQLLTHEVRQPINNAQASLQSSILDSTKPTGSPCSWLTCPAKRTNSCRGLTPYVPVLSLVSV